MPRYTLSTLLAVAAASSKAFAQDTTTTSLTPLASKHFDWTTLPYQADPDFGVRGSQSGYNRCNTTTENQQSLCQTSHLNSIDDFCLWAPPSGPTTIGDTEQLEVAWCTKPGYGTRVIPPGALQGVQFMRTPDYVQVVGFIDQTKINLAADDYGGELDPHGADFRGNPLGGLFYSNAFSNGNNNSYQQVIEWHNFMGGSQFCLKACNPAGANAANFCQHIYDRIGCAYNAPNNAQNTTFTSCDGDNQDFPGIYTDAAGAVQTYHQPAEALGPISTMPYQPKVPASSNCVTYTSSLLYAPAATDTVFSTTSTTPTATPTASGGSSKPPGSSTKSGSGSNPSATGGASGGDNSGASSVAVSSVASVMGVAFAVMFFA